VVNETQHRINHYFPEARVYFLDPKWTGSGKLKEGLQVITPEVRDIISINVSLNITSQPGTFTITLNNKNERYFIKDDLEFEIKNLNEAPFNLQQNTSNRPKSVYPYRNALEWLNHEEFKRLYVLSNGDIVTLERYQGKKDGAIGYWKRARDKNWLKEHGKENLDVVDEFIQLSGNDLKNVTNSMDSNLDLYEKYGGMIEQGRCIFQPMDRVVILLSKRFKTEKHPYDFINVFTGIVNSVNDDYTENFSKLTISGEDVTKWLRVTLANVNPSLLTEKMPDAGPDTMRVWSHRFADMEPWEIIRLLIFGGLDSDSVKLRGVGDFEYDPTIGPETSILDVTKGLKEGLVPTTFDYSTSYVNEGTQDSINDAKATQSGIVIRDDISQLDKLFASPKVHIQIPTEKKQYNTLGQLVTTPYKKFVKSSYDSYENEYKTHLDIIYELAKTTHFEFYADQNGDIWYHQPRFDNLHILTADIPEIYILQSEDIINQNFTESDEPIITSVLVVGQQDLVEGDQYPFNMVNFYEDKGLILKYGRRMITLSHPFVRTSEDCYYYAQSYLLRVLAERRTGSVTIVGRPEIRMAMPVYIPFRNIIYYVNSITHNFAYGETFTTTLGLTYGRKPWEPLPELLTYTMQSAVDSEVGEGNVSIVTTKTHEVVSSKYSKDNPLYWPLGSLTYILDAGYGEKIKNRTIFNLSGTSEVALPNGLDLSLASTKTAKVYATHNGKVIECDIDHVIIESTSGTYETHYYGLSLTINVNVGDTVYAGTQIGYVENALRYCMKRKEGFVNPEKYTKEKLKIKSGGTS